jgi:type IV pilus assembly protein PilQ
MFKRASSLSVLVAAAAFAPIVWALPVDNGASTPSEMAQASLPTGSGLVSLDFQDADIRSVLKVLAFKSGVNIVAAPDVTGVVNIELKDVPWQKALEVILSTYGYGFDRKDNIITVMSIDNLKKYREDTISLESQEPLVSKTYYLSFGKAEDVMKIIDKMTSKRGFINFDERTNAIIVRDLESNIELISGVIKSLDTITPEVMIETKVIETDLNNSDTLGIDWVLQASINGGSAVTTFPFTPSGGIFGSGGSGTFFPAAHSFSNFSMPSGSSSGSSGSSGSGSSTSSSPFTYGTINASTLSATLAALSTHQNTRTLSNPRVVTLDNEKVTFNVGLQYPMPQYSFNASTGQQQISGYTFTPIGINFEVTPHVNNAGWITLDLHPDISAIDQLVTLQQASSTSAPVQIPELSDRTIQTKVMVANGKTLVIAGLISDTKNVSVDKVPFLGDIPWLGKLFTSKNTTVTKTELLIFLTPHIITADDEKSGPADAV